MKIVYTKHASVDKFNILKKHKFKIDKKLIQKVIEEADHEDRESDKPNIIVSKEIDPKHVLRVVYKQEGEYNNCNYILPSRERKILLNEDKI